MARKGSILLAIAGLLGAGVTALLLFSLFGAEPRPARPAAKTGAGGGPAAAPVPERVAVRGTQEDGGERPPAGEGDPNAQLARIVTAFARERHAAARIRMGKELVALARGLGADMDAAIKAQLLDLVHKVDPGSRRFVGEALGALEGDEPTARRLLAILREQETPDAFTTATIFDALGRMRVAAVLPDLFRLLDGDAPGTPLVVKAIERIGGPEAGKGLLERLQATDHPRTRAAMVSALGASKDAAVLLAIGEALASAAPEERAPLVEIAGLTRDTRFAARLRELYESEADARARHRILQALGRCADRETALYLLRAGERDGPDASHAMRALHEIRAPEVIETLAAKWDELGARGRTALLGIAARMTQPPADLTAAARAALRDPDAQIRLSAAGALGRRGAAANVPALVGYLERSRDRRERTAALEALLRTETPAAAEAVLERLESIPVQVREGYRIRARAILDRGKGGRR